MNNCYNYSFCPEYVIASNLSNYLGFFSIDKTNKTLLKKLETSIQSNKIPKSKYVTL